MGDFRGFTIGNFNPRSPRGERPFLSLRQNAFLDISIHAPREGSDGFSEMRRRFFHANFNPRSPRGERRRNSYSALRYIYFNPRSPRGERPESLFFDPRLSLFQSTLPARGATCSESLYLQKFSISIHAPREGSDAAYMLHDQDDNISIHAPREGSDGIVIQAGQNATHFNPRSPRGERHLA